MKGFVIALCFILIGFGSVKAQTDQGTFLLGGNISYQASDGNDAFNFSPQLGVFVLNNFALGASLNIMVAESSLWAIGPYIRPYFLGSEKGKMFLHGQMLIGGGSGVDTKFGYGAGMGYAHFINSSVALEFYGIYTRIGDLKGIFTMGAGFQIHLR